MQIKRDTRHGGADIVRAIRGNSAQIAEAVARAFEQMPKWQTEAQNFSGARADYLGLQFQVFSDYAAEYFERGDVAFLHLFVGEMIKALYVPHVKEQEAENEKLRVLAALRERLASLLANLLSAGSWARFSGFLDDVMRTLSSKTDKVQRILLVGDCLFLDIVPFIVPDLLEAGIRLVADYATSKNPLLLRDELRAFSSIKFDLAFYSPFSYEFSLEYNQLLDWKNSMMREAAVRGLVQRAWEDARGTIDVLADLFDCPIHIHNSAAVVREESASKRLFKAKATVRNRTGARREINAMLTSYIQQKNTESYRHLFLFDELRLVETVGEIKAGAYLYKNDLQHPSVLGQIFAAPYADLIYVSAWLAKKKVVVCDLDNTLWKGVIGEGPVAHYHERQRALKGLKAKGVVLAINSKNDSANVHWRQGTLSDEDFVCSAISWEPKVHGMRRIQNALNLKIKDYIFIDDREDERELVHLSYPETLCLDAADERTWKRIALWEQILQEDPEMDRTLMYKQREARKAFIHEDVSSSEERAQLFQSLDLRLTIQRAQLNDLKRVTELINRTNQFNLEGSRTTFREVSAWHGSPDHLILLGRTSDRFGEMGTTCVAVVVCSATEMRILPFVLSCRVFGYGIEEGVMNHLKQIARQRGVQRVVGRYQPTPQNSPCKDFLANNGFQLVDSVWSIDTDAAPTPNPPWLQIKVI
jgi:FkbH-like protein